MTQYDERVIVLWIFLLTTTFLGGQCDPQVSQHPQLESEEGHDVTLGCNHTINNYKFIAWYKHVPGLALEICASGYSTGSGSSSSSSSSRVSVTMDKKSLSTGLRISRVRVADTAVYYCAVSDTVTVTRRKPVQ
ncbi:hypothetical protein FKM82_026771 [Ascaphus truei]